MKKIVTSAIEGQVWLADTQQGLAAAAGIVGQFDQFPEVIVLLKRR